MEEENKIHVWSAIMGSGKTNTIIEMLQQNPEGKILFVTEYKKEIERIQDAVKHIPQPQQKFGEGSKETHLLKLLKSGKNIATTHKLFTMIKEENYHLLADYTMILDEVLEVVDKIKFSEDDLNLVLRDGVIGVDANKKVFVINESYNGEFKKRIDKIGKGGCVLFQGQIIWSVNPDLFRSFKQILIATYNFEGSYMYSYLRKHRFTIVIENKVSAGRFKVSDYINLYEGSFNQKNSKPRKLKLPEGNTVNKKPLASGYYKLVKPTTLKTLSSNTTSFFRHFCETPSAYNAYACFDDGDDKLTKDRFGTKIAVNARAENKYGYKKSLAYLVDINPDPTIVNFLSEGSTYKFDMDAWSLSVLLQWMFRGCIRNVGNDDAKDIEGNWDAMNLFVPSFRMRNLLKEWLKKH